MVVTERAQEGEVCRESRGVRVGKARLRTGDDGEGEREGGGKMRVADGKGNIVNGVKKVGSDKRCIFFFQAEDGIRN